jgi:hypothetical protein
VFPIASSTEVSSQNTDEGPGSKAEKRKFQDVWKSSFLVSLVIYDCSNEVMYCYCMFAERQAQVLLAKPNLLLETNLNVKVLFRPKKNMCFRSTSQICEFLFFANRGHLQALKERIIKVRI